MTESVFQLAIDLWCEGVRLLLALGLLATSCVVVQAQSVARIGDGLQVLYMFDEGQGEVVHRPNNYCRIQSGVSFQLASSTDRKLEAYATYFLADT